jgi:hypothetical protein
LGEAKIYLNNDFVCKINGVSFPHSIPLFKNRLVAGPNELRIEFEKLPELNKLQNLSYISSPKIYKGLIREPLLIITSKVFISGLNYKILSNNSAEVNLDVIAGQISDKIFTENKSTGTLENQKIKVVAEYTLINKETKTQVSPTEYKEFSIEITRSTSIKFNISLQNLKY